MPTDLDHLIGRTLMVGIRGASPSDPILRADLDACRAAHIRAVILFDVHLPTRGPRNIESPDQLRDLCAHIKATLGEGTIIAIDQEGGRVARLKPERGFRASKSAAEVGAMSTKDRRAEADAEAAQLADLGITMNFAPCVDLGNNPDNPIITRLGRAYGAEPEHVLACVQDVIDAMRAHRVMPCLKHFPGHGSTKTDSHLDLPDFADGWCPSDALPPFGPVCGPDRKHIGFLMTGHLLHPGFDPVYPASLSHAISTEYLREMIGFEGVVITDSLDMGAITKRWTPEEAAVLALKAGADIALHAFNSPDIAPDAPHPAPAMAGTIRRAVASGNLSDDAIRASAGRIEALSRFPDA